MKPVLILGSVPRTAVAIARSLAKRSLSVSVAAISTEEPSICSRAIHRFIRLPSANETPVLFGSSLFEIVEKEGFDMVIPCNDSALIAIMEQYHKLSSTLRVACPPPDITIRVLDKASTLKVAEKCGIPVPRTFLLGSIEELESTRFELHFPMIAKPKNKCDPTSSFKIKYFTKYHELREVFEKDPRFGEKNLLQEYCFGQGVGIETLIHNGEPMATFQHRRLRELPSDGGVSVLAISEAVDPILEDYALTLLNALEWEGIAMVEFRYDPSIGTAKLMEVNGRYYGSLSLSSYVGIDFPLYQWQIIHNEKPFPPSSYPVGIRWRWTTGEIIRLHQTFNGPQKTIRNDSSVLDEVIAFTKGFSSSTRDALWRINDPLPAFFELSLALKDIVIFDVKHIVKKLLPGNLLHRVSIYRNLNREYRSTFAKLQLSHFFRSMEGSFRKSLSNSTSILVICHGNIIRSPMAEVLLRKYLLENNVIIKVYSAGLEANGGNSIDPRAEAMAKEFGVSLYGLKARPVTEELIKETDTIIVMDFFNETKLIKQYPFAKKKTFLLGSFVEKLTSKRVETFDPYDGDISDIRCCYQRIDNIAQKIANFLCN